MDDLEFRRRLLADPSDPELQASKAASPRHQRYAEDVANLDSKIDQALRVDVPEDLADKILFSQTNDTEQPKRRTRGYLAMAASIAFVFGLTLGQLNWGITTPDLNRTALDHYYHEQTFIAGINEAATVEQVNAKLQPFGKAFSKLPGEITYINHCSFGGQHALHMVMRASGQTYTVFVVPSASQAPAEKSDGTMHSVSLPVQSANVIVVGKTSGQAAPLAEQLQQQLTPTAI
ncbi:hypothetical protein BZG80_02325 [Salinivibrio sp. MA440]|uniref:DUF3379 family protein n=1 Tax=unclassified Salinivibrio TaxID=2636825 RepID=UPI00098921F2|nr:MULTISPECIES: DUF3379 family protein [unclassified Salinivibrio]NUY56323.1 DUF3379 family protein [Salinivibrio sp. EAGSL]OOF07044.1 hypothetical protein BZG80_02325 [Salinivibrio sp. MA440]